MTSKPTGRTYSHQTTSTKRRLVKCTECDYSFFSLKKKGEVIQCGSCGSRFK